MVTRAALSETLRRLGVTRLEATLSALARPAIRMRTEPCTDDDVPIGGSKFGGSPDLPDDVEWPRREGRPLAFIAQFNCRELQRFEAGAVLPSDGVLSFFYAAVRQPWGYDPADAGAARVLYHPVSAGVSRRAYPPEIAARALHDDHPHASFHTRSDSRYTRSSRFHITICIASRTGGTITAPFRRPASRSSPTTSSG